MMPADLSLGSIAVVGGGQVALLAATALARALPDARVTIINAPVDPSALADTAHTTLPSLLRLHRRLGLTEQALLTRASATHRLATRFDNWHHEPSSFFVGYGARSDYATPRNESIAGGLAEVGHFAIPSDDPASPLCDIDYALRVDPVAYHTGLTALARHLKITFQASTIFAITRRENDGIDTISLSDGTVVQADLYVDCSGPAALLRSDDQSWVNGSAHMPIDRIAYAEPAAACLSPLDTALAFDGGYALFSPGHDCMRKLIAWSTAICSDDDIAQHALNNLGGALGAPISIKSGRVDTPWHGNVLALGDAAATFDPIGWLNLHLVTVQIETFFDGLPRSGDAPAERQEYNRRIGLATERVLDFVAAHSVLQPWSAAWTASQTLMSTMSSLMRRGHLPAFEEDSVGPDLWRQLLAGVTGKAIRSPRFECQPDNEREANTRATVQRFASAMASSTTYPHARAGIIEANR